MLKYVDFNRSVQFAGVSIKKFDLLRDKGIALKPYRGGGMKKWTFSNPFNESMLLVMTLLQVKGLINMHPIRYREPQVKHVNEIGFLSCRHDERWRYRLLKSHIGF
jgi:hypothetical protein